MGGVPPPKGARDAHELAARMVPPLMMQTEFKTTKQRLGLPPALPDDDLIDGAPE
jgi:hypothetical protein